MFFRGRVVATPAVPALIQGHGGASVPELLLRHLTGDWQEMCREDQDANWATVLGGESGVFSSFNIAQNGHTGEPIKIWGITEWDWSVTPVLRPGDH